MLASLTQGFTTDGAKRIMHRSAGVADTHWLQPRICSTGRMKFRNITATFWSPPGIRMRRCIAFTGCSGLGRTILLRLLLPQILV